MTVGIANTLCTIVNISYVAIKGSLGHSVPILRISR